jgi:hypothetical protein
MAINRFETTDIETYPCGVTRHWLMGYPVVIIGLPDVKREIVDEWFDVCKSTLETFQGSALFAFHDMTQKHMALTPYAQAKAKELLTFRPELQVYTALYLNRTLIAQFVSVFLRRIYTHQQTQIFFDREAALKWLFECMKTYEKVT